MDDKNPELNVAHSKHLNLCRELNMDKAAEENSWKIYKGIIENFTLEGEHTHWLCCALYAACRESFTPTVGHSDKVVRGNCVSLTKLLRSCNISIYDFFEKIKKWVEMTNLSSNFRTQIERLERSFGISLVLFKKYNEIFDRLFIMPVHDKKNKKCRSGKCTASKLYDFCWCLYLCAKGEEPKYTVDLVTSFHLLLCCLDLIFANAVADNRKDLINPAFIGLPEKWNSPDYEPKKNLPICIMECLCKIHDVNLVDAMNMKSYSWKTIITSFINGKNLKGDGTTFMNIISNSYFDINLKSLNNVYEQYVLSVGEFDERIFLSNVSFRRPNVIEELDPEEREKQSQLNATIRSLVPGTPLTRRHHLPSKDITEPVASATQNVKKLRQVTERETPKEFLMLVTGNISKLEERLDSMSLAFCEKYPTSDEAEERFKLAKALYFNLLEKIVRAELRNKPNLDLKVLLDTEVFHTTLIACSVEIVLVAYNSQIKFPWILDCFDINAFHFYKIIEIVVLHHEDALTRFIIIHLNSIEEKCLDSLVWKSDSPLWSVLKQYSSALPSWVHVDKKNTNVLHDRKADEASLDGMLQSPVNSAYDCFSYQNINNDHTKRDIFNIMKENTTDGPTNVAVQPQNEGTPKKLMKTGSLFLFFRKFYKLAYMRISELCRELSMKNDEYLKQIWTLFEYSIVHKTELMEDRHLDQMLMCAIYVFIRVKDITEKTFTDIMRYYRNQPQAASNIYRHVLIRPAKQSSDGGDEKGNSSGQYGDIIQFYNLVYVQKMTPYALNFGDKSKLQSHLLLSPHPPERMMSPKKISSSHHLYIQPLEKKEISMSPNPITYEFCKSPAKDLQRMNQLIKSGKRTLPFNDDEITLTNKMSKSIISVVPKSTYITRKLHGIIQDRREEELNE